ncbi:hypothetical protein MAR_002593 [Mya arenaria]|uniref:Uncharacterized protein n=1 Tax=Mya arenaria TaxID=6604 RepID=A0ABY7G4D7_MYAAR|nr:hypothetical protein MAR_002593 [Mya arenaria]
MQFICQFKSKLRTLGFRRYFNSAYNKYLFDCYNNTSVVLEDCMFGNNPGIVTYETVTCNELLAFPNTSYKCYQSYCLNDCCETCEQIRLKNVNTTDCDYGDKASWCETMSLSGCYNNDDVCCQSCPRRALGIQSIIIFFISCVST